MGDLLLLTNEEAEGIRRREMASGAPPTERVMLAYHDKVARLTAEVERLRRAMTETVGYLNAGEPGVARHYLSGALAREDGAA